MLLAVLVGFFAAGAIFEAAILDEDDDGAVAEDAVEDAGAEAGPEGAVFTSFCAAAGAEEADEDVDVEEEVDVCEPVATDEGCGCGSR